VPSTYRTSIYALTWDALRIFREEMRNFVVDNLQRHFGNLWLAMGVDKHFKLEDLRRVLGQRDRPGQVVNAHADNFEDMLDITHFRRIVDGNWAQVFKAALGDRAILDQWIAEVTAARNPLAHWAGADMTRKDGLRVVDTCERVVRTISPKRADELLAIWQEIDARGRDEVPDARRATLVFDDGRRPERVSVVFDEPLAGESTDDDLADLFADPPHAVAAKAVIDVGDDGDAGSSAAGDLPRSLPAYVTEARKKYPRAYEPWTEPEDQQIIDLAKIASDLGQVAEITRRGPGAIRSRLLHLGVTQIGGHPLS